MRVTPSISIGDDEITESFVRASGPGGQNVNKVASAVQMRFDIRGSPTLPPGVKARLERLGGSRVTRDGVLVIFADRFRSQDLNRQDARETAFPTDRGRREGAEGQAPDAADLGLQGTAPDRKIDAGGREEPQGQSRRGLILRVGTI